MTQINLTNPLIQTIQVSRVSAPIRVSLTSQSFRRLGPDPIGPLQGSSGAAGMILLLFGIFSKKKYHGKREA